jgi:flavin-dependent dehydrogenase
MRTDVLIVGGGPAGLAAALALRQRGASVTVADAMRSPIDKACGEGLMPDSLQELSRLGVELAAEDGAEFRGIQFVNGAHAATAQFPACSDQAIQAGIGLRRQTLHSKMMAQAEDTGVNLRWQNPVQLKADGSVLVAGESIQYAWLIGADGQSSRVRRWAGLERGPILSRRFGFRQHFAAEPWSPYVEVHWGKSGQAYVTPVGPNEVCIAAVTRDPHCRLSSLLAELPRLQKRLRGAGQSGANALDSERGALTTTHRLRRVASGRVALVGDASGSADAITGEGMGMAFRQAPLLAECLETGNLDRYNRLHPATLQLPQAMARIILLMDRSPAFRDRAIGMLAKEPALFARLLAVHLGTESITRFVAAKGLEMVWRLGVSGGLTAIVDRTAGA